MTTTLDRIEALAPRRAAPDAQRSTEWSAQTLATILADDASAGRRRPRTTTRRLGAILAGGALVAGAGTVAMAATQTGPFAAVEQVLGELTQRPDSTAYGRGPVGDPTLLTRFDTPLGPLSVWTATLADGTLCTAEGFGTDPVADDLEYGCDQVVLDHADPDRVVALDRPTRLGGFTVDGEAGSMVHGVAPYADARWVRLEGPGLRRVLAVDAGSRGFGAALPAWDGGRRLELTWLDGQRRVLGSEEWVAPLG